MPGIATAADRQPDTIQPNGLVSFLARTLRPLVLLVLKKGMTAYEFNEIVRWIFATVAMDKKQFSVQGRDAWSTTRARAAVLTGLTRREVNRLTRLPEPSIDDTRANYHRSQRILEAWMTSPGYQAKSGEPADLPIRGEGHSLEQLVREHCRDITVRAMLDELEARGCVTRLDRNTVRYIHADCSDYSLPEDQARFMAEQTERCLHTASCLLREEAEEKALLSGLDIHHLAPEHREAFVEHVRISAEAFLRQARMDSQDFCDATAAETSHAFVGIYCSTGE